MVMLMDNGLFGISKWKVLCLYLHYAGLMFYIQGGMCKILSKICHSCLFYCFL